MSTRNLGERVAGVAALLLVWLVFGIAVGGGVGYAIGQGKGRAAAGFWLGALLGVIGWIIVAVMEPSEDIRRQREATTLATAAAMLGGNSPRDSLTDVVSGGLRPCPWCAEHIKAAAKVCRYCGREVDPIELSIPSYQRSREELLFDAIRDEFPTQFDAGKACLLGLEVPPERPAEWLRELCYRVSQGAPLEVAATRVPLDWAGPLPVITPEPVMPKSVALGDPNNVGEFEGVKSSHSKSYNTARALLAGMDVGPEDPAAWLEELCSRIDQGAPPQAAAARIPLNWQSRVQRMPPPG